MKLYARLYYWYESSIGRLFRLCIFLLILLWAVFVVLGGNAFSIATFDLYLLVMLEIFFQFKIARLTPRKKISETTKAEDALTIQALSVVVTARSSADLLRLLSHYPAVRFFARRVGLDLFSLPVVEIPLPLLLSEAMNLAQEAGGQEITTLDVFAAYIYSLEDERKILFAQSVKKEDFLQILKWTRFDFPDEEKRPPIRAQFHGEGIGEALVNGWTYETHKYTENFTYKALAKQPILIGRDKEYDSLQKALLQGESHNVLIVSDIGSGKENLISKVAMESYFGNLPEGLAHKNILELLVGAFIAGATSRSDEEERLQAVIEEISHAPDVMLYIPELQDILGASSYGIDLSGALLPYLKDDRFPVIATMTPENYKVYMERNPLREVFEVIHLSEPSVEDALQMVWETVRHKEQQYHGIFTYKALQAAVTYAHKFLQDTALPGSAITLLEETASRLLGSQASPFFAKTHQKLITASDVMATIEDKTHVALSEPQGDEKALLLHLEEKLHERVIGQEAAISAISHAMRRYRSGLENPNRPISFLFLGPTGVGKTETAKALADLYYGGTDHIIRLDMSEYADSESVSRLLGAAPGKGSERGELTDKIHDHPASLVLLDEFEKAHPKILDLFLQVLDEGRLTDNTGRTVSFANAFIIATSNAGAELIREQLATGGSFTQTFHQQLLDELQKEHLFRPELLNRFDGVIIFSPLTQTDIESVGKLLLRDVTEKLKAQDITVTFDKSVLTKLATEGYDIQFGARPLRRYIQDTIEDALARKKIQDEIKRGDTLHVSVSEHNTLRIQADS